MRLPWQQPLLSNGPLDIQQLWASQSRTREPILMKFSVQQQIRTTVTVTWSNITIFKIQNDGQSLLENIRNVITRLSMDRLGRNLGGRIPLCSQYWKCYNSSYDGTDWDNWWSRPSNTSAAKPFPWYLVVTANRTVNVLVLWGVEIKNIHNFDETWMIVPLWYKKIYIIW